MVLFQLSENPAIYTDICLREQEEQTVAGFLLLFMPLSERLVARNKCDPRSFPAFQINGHH